MPSIAANIAEGNGRFTKADRRNFFAIARGSVMRLLELASRQNLLQPERHQQHKADLEEIARMLSGLINGLDKRGSPRAEHVRSGTGEQAKLANPR